MTAARGFGSSSNTGVRPAAFSSMIVLDPGAVLVDVLLRFELVAEGVDEALRHLQLLVGDLDLVQFLELVDRRRLDQLVGEHERATA